MSYTIGSHSYNFSHTLVAVLIVLAVWELIWKGIALWRAGKNGQLAWFVIMLVLNTAGILEIVYLIFFSKKSSKK